MIPDTIRSVVERLLRIAESTKTRFPGEYPASTIAERSSIADGTSYFTARETTHGHDESEAILNFEVLQPDEQGLDNETLAQSFPHSAQGIHSPSPLHYLRIY